MKHVTTVPEKVIFRSISRKRTRHISVGNPVGPSTQMGQVKQVNGEFAVEPTDKIEG